MYFFRDPKRMVPDRKGLIVSPADGLIVFVGPVPPPAELDLGTESMTKISIFMNVFDVHVNRIPLSGMITKIHYYPGKFFNATLDKASEHNERQAITITTEDNLKIGCIQIAGLIARRIHCDVKVGQSVSTGERYGIIRFGSRVDLYFPSQFAGQVIKGQRVIGGETVLVDCLSQEEQRVGKRI
jgi:phosphatidylserine decarboxylase